MARELLIKWLNDAYSMEKALIPVLESHIKEAADYPDMQAKMQAHCIESKHQAEEIKECIERLGGTVSGVKLGIDRLFGAVNNFATGLRGDDVVKNAALDLAAEHMEIATYRAIVEAARAGGDELTAQLCEDICLEEQAMATWLEEQMPALTRAFLRRQMEEEGTQAPMRERFGSIQPAFGESLEDDLTED